jgi:nucleotide-binding universal stress UspA family protein
MPIEPIGPVVVGVDGSAASMAAVDLAAEEATGRIVPLLVVHASGEPGPDVLPVERAERILDMAVSRALADHPILSVWAERVVGPAADALVDRSKGASLLVLGHRPSGPQEHAGSVAQWVARRVAVPVMVRRPLDTTAPTVDEPWPVAVCIAGASGDDQVAEFAFGEASLRGAPLRAVHIWPGTDVAPSGEHVGFADARDAADQAMVDTLAPWSEKYPDVVVHRVIRHGLDLPVSLTAASRSAQLIIVGSSRREETSTNRPWVVETLIHRASCGVAVVPVN